MSSRFLRPIRNVRAAGLAMLAVLAIVSQLVVPHVTAGSDDTSDPSASEPVLDACASNTSSASPAPSATATAGGGQAQFTLCGSSDQTARAIEQLIAGRGFSATLTGHNGDACADLVVGVSGDSGSSSSSSISNQQSSTLSVDSGGRTIRVRISSTGGTTQVQID